MIARLRRGPRMGAIYEATPTESFGPALLEAMRSERAPGRLGRHRPVPGEPGAGRRRDPLAGHGPRHGGGADQQLDQHRRQGDAEDLSPAGGGRASRDRDEPLPDRGRRIRQYAQAPRRYRICRGRRHAMGTRPGAGVRAQPGLGLGACRALSRPVFDAARVVDPGAGAPRRRSATPSMPSRCASWPGASRRCIRPLPSIRRIPPSSGRSDREGSGGLAPALPRGCRATFDALQAAQKTAGEPRPRS